MFSEAGQAPNVVRGQLENNAVNVRRIGCAAARDEPTRGRDFARGSSDHAATFAKYLIESAHQAADDVGLAVHELAVQRANRTCAASCFSSSHSRARAPTCSPRAENAKRNGACVIALCNSPASPLAQMAHHTIPLSAGPETSVAATKSYIASLSAIVHLVACWTSDQTLINSLMRAPRAARTSVVARLERGAAGAGASEQFVRGGPRLWARRRARSGAEVQGNLRPACRSLQRGRSETWADGAGAAADFRC